MNECVAVAMSGGLDSSVSAALLKARGCNVIGITMVLPGIGDGVPDDTSGAEAACERLGIRLHVIDASKEFLEAVAEPFCREYLQGRTPNPCVLCNSRIKFGRLLDRALSLGASRLATGHYAGVEYEENTGRYTLRRGIDGRYDQSYFLWRLSRDQLARAAFPLAGTTRKEVAGLALEHHLGAVGRKSSQDICFLPGGDYRSFIIRRHPEAESPGAIEGPSGGILGEHRGFAFYTVGQREGLGIAWKEPLYVIRMEHETNTLVVGPREETYSTCLVAGSVNWISIERPSEPVSAQIQVRYNQRPVPGRVRPAGEGKVEVTFHTPVSSVAPGQSAVFYNDNTVLGGGVIE